MNYQDILVEKINKEREVFKHEYAEAQGCQVYEDWYVIGFYESYYEMLTSDFVEYDIYEDMIKWLSDFEEPLSFLYCEWLSCDGHMSHGWDDMLSWLHELYEEVTNQ